MPASAAVYPWDVCDDPELPAVAARIGVRRVSIAAVYHAARVLSPRNPRRKVVDAHHAARYFVPRSAPAGRGALRALAPDWTDEDAFEIAAGRCRAQGLAVFAWVVATHSSVLGRAHPNLTITNAFGDRYAHALCPAQDEVRAYAAELVSDLADRRDVDGIELEACGYHGYPHGSHHEKLAVAVDDLSAFLLSLCFCSACCRLMEEQSLDLAEVRRDVRTLLGSQLNADIGRDRTTAVTLDDLLGPTAPLLLEARRRGADGLLAAVAAALPSPRPLIALALGPSELSIGAAVGWAGVGETFFADEVLAPTYGLDARLASETVRATAGRSRARVRAAILAGEPDVRDGRELSQRIDDARASGASAVHIYHLGLLADHQLDWVAAALRCEGAG